MNEQRPVLRVRLLTPMTKRAVSTVQSTRISLTLFPLLTHVPTALQTLAPPPMEPLCVPVRLSHTPCMMLTVNKNRVVLVIIIITVLLLCTVQCPSGQEMNAMTQQCQPCARGYYKDNRVSPTASFAACQPCSSGTITPTNGSTSQSQCTQGDCPPGSYMDPNINTQCNWCDIGTYQPVKWQMTCLSCPSGSTTTTTGSVYPSDCNGALLWQLTLLF